MAPVARVGLVLGAGGVAGAAWHAGTLSAVAAATGWDARGADIVVGTSAGSIAGAALRAGLGPADQFALAVGGAPTAAGARLVGRLRGGAGPGAGGAWSRSTATTTRTARPRFPTPANAGLLRTLAPWDRRPGVALAGLLPAGVIDASEIGTRIEELHGGPSWPTAALWIVAVALGDGRRVAFGRDDIGGDPPLGAAVAASCAVPGLFSPVRVLGRRYVDGGVHATTNVDLVADAGLDLVVVSAPMAGSWRSLRAHPAALSRSAARVALDREVDRVRRRGTPVLVLQPQPEDTPIMDGRAMDPSSRAPVAERAKASVLTQLERRHNADAVAALRSAS